MIGVGEQVIHALVVAFGKKQWLVLADEVHGIEYLAAIDTTLQIADKLGCVTQLPLLLKSIHDIHQRIEGFFASELCGVGREYDRHLTLVAHVVIDRGVAFLLGVGGQEVGDVFLIVQTQSRKHAQGRDDQQ